MQKVILFLLIVLCYGCSNNQTTPKTTIIHQDTTGIIHTEKSNSYIRDNTIHHTTSQKFYEKIGFSPSTDYEVYKDLKKKGHTCYNSPNTGYYLCNNITGLVHTYTISGFHISMDLFMNPKTDPNSIQGAFSQTLENQLNITGNMIGSATDRGEIEQYIKIYFYKTGETIDDVIQNYQNKSLDEYISYNSIGNITVNENNGQHTQILHYIFRHPSIEKGHIPYTVKVISKPGKDYYYVTHFTEGFEDPLGFNMHNIQYFTP